MYRLGKEIRSSDTNAVLGTFSNEGAASRAFDLMMPRPSMQPLEGYDLKEFERMKARIDAEFEGSIFC